MTIFSRAFDDVYLFSREKMPLTPMLLLLRYLPRAVADAMMRCYAARYDYASFTNERCRKITLRPRYDGERFEFADAAVTRQRRRFRCCFRVFDIYAMRYAPCCYASKTMRERRRRCCRLCYITACRVLHVP